MSRSTESYQVVLVRKQDRECVLGIDRETVDEALVEVGKHDGPWPVYPINALVISGSVSLARGL